MSDAASSAGIHVLIVAIGLVQMLYAVAWLTAARQLPGANEASLYMGVYCGGTALSLFLTAGRGGLDPWFSVIGANFVSVVAYVGLRRASNLTFELDPADAEHAAILLLSALALVLLGPDEVNGPMRAAMLGALVSYLVLRTVLSAYKPCCREFGLWPAITLQVPAAIVAALMLVRSLWVMAVPEAHFNLDNDGRGNALLLYALLVIGSVTNFAGWAVYVIRMVRSLDHLARCDPLTGLLNRRAMDRALQIEWLRRARNGSDYAVLLADVDYFKRINDSLGHAAGDEVLRVVAQRLASGLRPVDQVSRFGGEEFLLLLPDTDLAGAMAVAERLRQVVCATPVKVDGRLVTASISIGVAAIGSGDRMAESPVQRADAAMYAAKNAGRNCVRGDHWNDAAPAA